MVAASKAKPSVEECDRIITAPGQVLEMEELTLDGRTVRTWKNCPKTFRSFFLDSIAKYASREFISSPTVDTAGRETVTFQHVLEKSLQLAAWLRKKGMEEGCRVAIGGGNSTDWVVAFVAIHLLGGVAVCLNAWLPIDQLVHCLALTQPELILVDPERADLLDGVARQLYKHGVGKAYCWGDNESDTPTLDAAWRSSEMETQRILKGEFLQKLGPESDSVIFFSSGTSGKPKAILSTQRMALTNLWSGLVAPSRAALRAGVAVPPLPKATDPQKVVLLSIPLFHVTGCLSWLMRAFFGGSKMVMMHRWSVKEAVGLIASEKVTVIGGVPAVVSSILQSPDLDRSIVPETVFYGGAPPSKQLAKEVKTRWPKAGLVQGYGLTETNAYVCSVAGQDYVDRPDSTGPPVPVCDIRIIDPDTKKPLPAGQVGLLTVRGPQVMKCYVADQAATQAAIDAEGWLDTGDVGMVDDEGFLYIKDRLKDIIIRGGENVASTDVENALYAHSGVSEAVAIGVPDDILGEKVGAVVSLREQSGGGVTEDILLEHVKTRLGRPAWPSIILVHSGALPRNVNGKVVKKDIKPMLVKEWEKRGRVDAGKVKSRL